MISQYQVCFLLLSWCCLVSGEGFKSEENDMTELGSDPRLFFVNLTSSLIQVNSTILALALLALTIAGATGIALYYLYLESASAGTGYGYSYQQYGQDSYEQEYQAR